AITAGPSGAIADTTPTFEFGDGEQGSRFECRVDGAAFLPCDTPFTTNALTDGHHTFQVRAIDAADNVDPTAAEREFDVDTAAPQTTIDGGPSGPVATATPTFAMSSSEPGSTFECQVDNGPFAACSSPFTSAPLSDGPHTITIRAVDAAGNPDPNPPSHSIVVDTAAPDTSIV